MRRAAGRLMRWNPSTSLGTNVDAVLIDGERVDAKARRQYEGRRARRIEAYGVASFENMRVRLDAHPDLVIGERAGDRRRRQP